MTLSLSQRDFIKAMKQSREAESDGFSILARRPDAADYFDELIANGLGAPDRNKGPVAASREGFVRLPYWSGLGYLLAVSKIAGRNGDNTLGSKIVRLISGFTESADDNQRQNYNTWHRFAECLSLLPLASITADVVNQTRVWVQNPFERSLVARELGMKLVPRLANSAQPHERALAVTLVDIITSIRFVPKRSESDPEPDTEVDRHIVHELVKQQVSPLAAVEPAKLAELFQQRVHDVFTGARESASWLYRPAVETYSQNMTWQTAENMAVEGLFETLKIWTDNDPQLASAKIRDLFESDNGVARRVNRCVRRQIRPTKRTDKLSPNPSTFRTNNAS